MYTIKYSITNTINIRYIQKLLEKESLESTHSINNSIRF